MEPEIETLLKELASADPAVRDVAAKKLRSGGSLFVFPLGNLMGGSDKPMAKAAKKTLEDVAHHAARPGAPGRETQAVADRLVMLALASQHRAVRAHALYLLGLVGGDRQVADLARLQADAEVGEDARMALERIDSGASRRAMKRVKA